MRYKILVAHPNDMLNNIWKEVDTFDDPNTMIERIASPSFDWYPGMLVQCYDHGVFLLYSGIYGHNECVDIGGYQSRVMKKYYYKITTSLPAGGSYSMFWKESYEGCKMFKSLSMYMPKAYVLKLLCGYVGNVMAWIDPREKRPVELFDAIERGASDDVIENMRELNATYTAESGTFQREIGIVLDELGIAATIDDLRSVTYNIALMTRNILANVHDVSFPDEDRILADWLRKTVPFYDIAIEIVK